MIQLFSSLYFSSLYRRAAALSLLCLFFSSVASAQLDTSLFSGMKARCIGPAGMSGRVAAIDVVESNPNIMYVGAATGGLWKSTSGGIAWKPIFDNQATSSIGAVAVCQANPSIVWVGTGEGNVRNSAGVGYGIYKSMDGGETWQWLGLEKTERIHRIILHPSDPNIAYAAAMGNTWSENDERGVYKTVDGGKSWKKILFVNNKTGCGDLVIDPKNPSKLFASMWEHRRYPWFFNSGGAGSGIYVTHDGGETWNKLTEKDGMPKGDLGRAGVAISYSNPDVVYALVEAKKSALLRSDNGGATWRTVNNTTNIAARPFYFCDIRVDPDNENRVYNMFTIVTVSNDGGKTFQTLIPYNSVHPDHHALWIHPKNGAFMVNGNDGGIAISYDRGATWRFVENLPLAQFYHVSVDNETPYHIYGGLQDNGSWRGPSSVWENGGIKNYHWDEVCFGDGFATVPDPKDASIGYAMWQGGNLVRFNVKTGERKSIRPAPPSEDVKLRFNWNSGISIDPFDAATVYYGSQFLHKSTNRGDSWTIISPDLTTNDKDKQQQDESGGLSRDVTAAENHCTILTIAPSAVKQGVIWVGTDDGNVQLTEDGGKTWKNVVGNIPNVPKATWCPHIEASKFDAGTAYVVFDDHRRGNWKTFVFKTTDYGKTWTDLTKSTPVGLPKNAPWGFAHTIEQDPVKKDLLYLGTEFGFFVSLDDGKSWMKWTHGFPTVPVTEFAVHPRDHDLIIATHGRALYVIDDIRPLRMLSPEVFKKSIHLFDVPSAILYQEKQESYHFSADAMFKGENRLRGAMLTYSLNPPEDTQKSKDDTTTEQKKFVQIDILNSSGSVIRNFRGSMNKGINRAVWNLRENGVRVPGAEARRGTDGDDPQGLEVLPGKYTARLKMGKEEVTASIEVLPDPRYNISPEERKKKYDTMAGIQGKIKIVAEAVSRIQNTVKSVDMVLEQTRERKDSAAADLKRAGEALKKTLASLSEKFVMRQDRQGLFRGGDEALGKLSGVMNSMGSSWDAPTETQLAYLKYAESTLEKSLAEFNKVFDGDVKKFQEKIEAAKVLFFTVKESLDMNWTPKGATE